MNNPFTGRAVALACAAGLFGFGPATAQEYPTRPIMLVVPFAAGGPSDVIARLIGNSMSRSLGQQIVIENTAGAGGTIAAARVAKAPGDGYTLLIHHIALPLGAALYRNLAYDAATAFEPIGLVNSGPYVLTTRAGFGPNSAAELFAKLRKDGENVKVAHAGAGSGSHLCTLMLMKAVGFKATLVAYRGTGPALNDVVAGHADVLCDQTTNTLPQVAAKTILAFAITSAERNPSAPEIPTMVEVGFKDIDLAVWHALYAPKGTPAAIVAKLNGALRQALDEKDIAERFGQLGTFVYPSAERSMSAHAAKLATEMQRFARIVRENDLQSPAP